MQDFLSDRPTLEPQDARIVCATPPSAAVDGGEGVPFARIVRGAAPADSSSAAGKPAGAAGAAGACQPQVRTVVKDGRVTRIMVTCSCGKVTEIDCVY